MENQTAVTFGQKQLVKWLIVGGKLHAIFRHGGEAIFNPAELSEDVRAHGLLHGLKQRLADAYAGAKGDGLTSEDIEARVLALWDALHEGWSTRGESGGMLAQAIAKVTGQDLGKVIERLKGLSKADVKKLEANEKIADVLAAMRREKAGNGMSDDELNELF